MILVASVFGCTTDHHHELETVFPMSPVWFRPRCPICFEPLDPVAIYSLPCGHTFDEKFNRKWPAQSKTCPSCRATTDSECLVKVHFDFPTLQRSVEVETLDAAPFKTGASRNQSKQMDSVKEVV